MIVHDFSDPTLHAFELYSVVTVYMLLIKVFNGVS